jgi:NodT family efflux transporter outer membrane factor (OMF) lipoprotein
VPAPQAFTNDAASKVAEAILSDRWWGAWNDPVLDELVEKAVSGNIDIKLATSRVAEAFELLTQAGGARLPRLDLNATTGRARRAGATLGDSVNDVYSVGLTLAYEADIWKKNSYRQSASAFEVEALQAEQTGVYHAIVAAVVRSYIDLRTMNELAELTLSTAETDKKRLEIVENRYENGLAPSLDVYLSRQTVAEARSRVHFYRLQADNALHALNVLLGRYPTTPVEDSPALAAPEHVPAGLPSALLTRRPDLIAATHRLEAARYRIGEARGALMPRLSLTASGGFESDDLSDLLDADQLFWNLLANLAAPLFDGGRLRSEVARQEILQDRALLVYGQKVLEAFRQVEDAISTENHQRLRLESLVSSVELAERSLETSEERYMRGLSDLITSLNARQSLNFARTATIEARRSILHARVGLHLALGGHWGHEIEQQGISNSNRTDKNNSETNR